MSTPWTKPEPEKVPRICLSSEEAAQALGASKRMIDQLAIDGELPSFKIGARRFFAVDSLRAWAIAQSQIGHGTE